MSIAMSLSTTLLPRSFTTKPNPMFKAGIHYDLNIERAVLGICFFEPHTASVVLSRVKKEWFHDYGHQKVLAVMQELRRNKQPIDLLTVAHFLFKAGYEHINNWATPYFLAKLTNHVVSGAHTGFHVALLGQLHEAKELESILRSGTPKGGVAEVKAKLAAMEPKQRPRKIPISLAKYLLTLMPAARIRPSEGFYGRDTILASTRPADTIRVPDFKLVFTMHLILPEYTWTCGGTYDTELTRAECVARINQLKTASTN